MSIEPHKWTRQEYERMAADGYFHPEPRVELIEGVIYDRRLKLPLYARHEIPECWVLNLREEALEVYREPSGGLNRSRASLIEGDTVSPLARPEAVIQVAELIP